MTSSPSINIKAEIKSGKVTAIFHLGQVGRAFKFRLGDGGQNEIRETKGIENLLENRDN